MDKKSISILFAFVFIAGFSFWHFFSKDQGPTNDPVQFLSQDVDINDFNGKAPQLENDEEPYKRSQRVRPLFNSDIRSITADFTDEKRIQSIALKIKERANTEKDEFDFSDQPQWDLTQLPSTQEEYDLFIEEAKINSLNKLALAATKDDLKGVRMASAAYTAMSVLGQFSFRGYDKEGHLGLTLPDDFVAFNQKMRSRYELQAKAFSRKRSVANTEEETLEEVDTAADAEDGAEEIGLEEEEEFSLEALFQEQLQQSAYFADLENPNTIADKYWSGDKSLFSRPTEAIDFLINGLANNGLFYKTPTGIYDTNLDVIKETLIDAERRPERYGIQGQEVYDLTDLGYEVFAEAVTRSVAINHALFGAALTTALGQGVVDKIQDARFFAIGVLATIGVESIFAAMGCYWGNMRLIMLHRFYSYVRDSRDYYRNRNRDFVLDDFNDFNPDRVYVSETTRIELNKSWLWGFGFGSFVNRLITVPNLGKVGETIALWAFQKTASSQAFTRATGRTISWVVTNVMTESIGDILGRIWRLPLPGLSWAGKVMDFFKWTLSATPATIAVYLLDFGFTSAAIYTSIHTKLYASTIMLDRIYYAPEMAIHLAHMEDWHGGRPFKQTTRELFYPLCAYMASIYLNAIRMVRYSENDSDSRIAQLFRNRKNNCLELIAAFEEIPVDEAADKVRTLEDEGVIAHGTHATLTGDRSLPIQRVSQKIADMHVIYPEFYRIIWISALQSIFEPRHLPDGYYGIKNLIINGTGGDEIHDFNSYFDFSSHKLAEKINTHRFEYIIEKLAFRARALKIEAGRASEADPLDLTEAFIIYWKYHRANERTINGEFLELLEQEERGFWGQIWAGLEETMQNIRWIAGRLTSNPYELSEEYRIEQNIDAMVQRQEEQADGNCWFFGAWCSSN